MPSWLKKPLLVTLAWLTVLVLVTLVVPYQVMVVLLTVVSLSSSTYFVVTWSWSILRAKRRGEPMTYLGVLDYAGLPTMVMIYTALALVDIIQNGIVVPPDLPTYLRRVVLYGIITLIAVIRATRWIRYQRADLSALPIYGPLRSASSEHHKAMEG